MKLLVLLASAVALSRGEVCIGNGIFNEQFNKCYHFFKTPQIYEEAQQVCKGIGGRLVCIHNAFAQTLVYGNSKTHFSGADYWIGLAALDEPGNFEWADQVQSDFSYWQNGYPVNNDALRCVAARLLNGRWVNAECDTQKKNFVCEVDTSKDAPQERCPNALYNEVADKCFYIVDSRQDFDDAGSTCATIKGYLAVVDDKQKQDFLYTEVQKRKLRADYWIGLRDMIDNGNWQWVDDSSNYSYTHWEAGFPIDSAEMDCGAVLLTDGYWYNQMCDDILNSFVCETNPPPRPTTTTITTPTTTTTTTPTTTTTTATTRTNTPRPTTTTTSKPTVETTTAATTTASPPATTKSSHTIAPLEFMKRRRTLRRLRNGHLLTGAATPMKGKLSPWLRRLPPRFLRH